MLLAHGSELICLMLPSQRLNNGIKVALHNLIELVESQVDAMIGHASLRVVIGANSVRSIARPHQGAPLSGLRSCRLLLGRIEKLRLQQRHGSGSILMLRSFVLTFHHDAGRNVRQTYR